MKPDLILIANAAQARLFRAAPGEPLVLVQSFEHQLSRAKAAELAPAPAGRGRSDHSSSGAGYPPRVDAKEKEHHRFARELAEHIEQRARQNDFKGLGIFASNPFLGTLKAELGSATARLLSCTHALDLTTVGEAELGARIRQELAAK